jgi:hypothetical protein
MPLAILTAREFSRGDFPASGGQRSLDRAADHSRDFGAVSAAGSGHDLGAGIDRKRFIVMVPQCKHNGPCNPKMQAYVRA